MLSRARLENQGVTAFIDYVRALCVTLPTSFLDLIRTCLNSNPTLVLAVCIVQMADVAIGRDRSISSDELEHSLPLCSTSNATNFNSYLSLHHSDDDVFGKVSTNTSFPQPWAEEFDLGDLSRVTDVSTSSGH